MSFTHEQFEKEFYPKLGDTRRWQGFSYLGKELSGKDKINIVEVGSIRVEDAWEPDGQTTRIWNWILDQTTGFAYSIDRNEDATGLVHKLCPNVSTMSGDGIMNICMLGQQGVLNRLDLLFLDAMDFTGPHTVNSWIQHIGFLAAAWPSLPSGCLIACDDCQDDGEGKHIMIKAFFDRIGVKPEVASYIMVWKKP